MHAGLVIAAPKIQFGEEHRALELIEELIDEGGGDSVMDGLAVQGSVV